MFDKLKDECGVFGIFNNEQAAHLTYLGIYALQHRGQESCGIACTCDNTFTHERGMGHVHDFFTPEKIAKLTGNIAVGHTRYSTTGASNTNNIQPLVVQTVFGKIALAHNGNLVNAVKLRNELEENGAIFQTTSDSEVILHLIAHSKSRRIVSRIQDATAKIRGAFCLIFMSRNKLIGVRDPHGVRPLSLGKLDGSYVLSSETCAFDLIGAEFIREIKPGEMIVIEKDNKIESFFPSKSAPSAFCVFEYIYFARPDSILFNHSTYKIRKLLGELLYKETAIDADIVIPVPESGVPAALGYSQASGIPFEKGLIKNNYIGRTFIQPHQKVREFGVQIKLNPVKDILKGKRVIVVDDSVVRGTTSRKIIKMIRNAGATEVHMRISSPPVMFPCYYGIDTPSINELIANNYSLDGIRKFIMADSLEYLNCNTMLKAIQEILADGTNDLPTGFCSACFDGKYPIDI